ncbi:MAG: DUF2652 domain-containing protein [Bacteroidetes bacterium]|nr:DUF2652 domain-containing protein [Bacteroidota bacterium]
MESKQLFIAIVDISGYTNFLRRHEGNLVHAERIILDLLERIVRTAGSPLILHEMTGDAVTFHAYGENTGATASAVLHQMRRCLEEVHSSQKELLANGCPVCATSELSAKAIVHYGDAVVSQLGSFTKIAGPEVIFAHRLLKNSVTEDSYILMTAAFYDLMEDFCSPHAYWQLEDCAGFGEVAVLVWYPVREQTGTTKLQQHKTGFHNELVATQRKCRFTPGTTTICFPSLRT